MEKVSLCDPRRVWWRNDLKKSKELSSQKIYSSVFLYSPVRLFASVSVKEKEKAVAAGREESVCERST